MFVDFLIDICIMIFRLESRFIWVIEGFILLVFRLTRRACFYIVVGFNFFLVINLEGYVGYGFLFYSRNL